MKMAEEEKKRRKEKGRRMVIEEVDGEEDENIEEIVCDKPPTENGGEPGDTSPLSSTTPTKTIPNGHVSTEPSQNIEEPIEEISDVKQSKQKSSQKNETTVEDVVKKETVQKSNPTVEQNVEEGTETTSVNGDIKQVQEEKTDQVESNDSSPDAAEVKHERPVLVQMPLSNAVQQLRESGNNLFRTGQYGEAIHKYTEAINRLEKGKIQLCFCFNTIVLFFRLDHIYS